MFKKFKKKLNNRGSSFVFVIVTVGFIGILVASLLIAALACYRLKLYDLNSRNNFYACEQAMDEIYSGVGNITMEHLKTAYTDTVDVMVHYDLDQGKYVTMDEQQANDIMRAKFINSVKTDQTLLNVDADSSGTGDLSEMMQSCITDPNVVLDDSNLTASYDESKEALTIHNVTVKRTVNERTGTDSAKYVQSITTDIVIGKPDFNVSFSGNSSATDVIFDYALVADKGVEFKGNCKTASVTGNIYAASDFYNKEYDKDADTRVISDANYARESSSVAYSGLFDDSMYSGFYVDGAKVTVTSDRMIVPGSIAAMNSGTISVSNTSNNATAGLTEVWADNIVLAGSTKMVGEKEQGSTILMSADCYIADDLEINSDYSSFTLAGYYYGYNNGTRENYRELVPAAAQSTYYAKGKGEKEHYNSSSIAINGKMATLNLVDTKNLYLAGKSYLELSKYKRGTNVTYYSYVDGDYETGESLAIKSNQLMYIPNGTVKQNANGQYTMDIKTTAVKELPEFYKDFFNDLENVPVVNKKVNNKDYYFFDMERAKVKNPAAFVTCYNAYVRTIKNQTNVESGTVLSMKESALTDLTEFESFPVNKITLPNSDKIFSNGALSKTTNSGLTLLASSDANVSQLADFVGCNTNDIEKASAGDPLFEALKDKLEDKSDDSVDTEKNLAISSGETASATLQKEYKVIKSLLTYTANDSDLEAQAANSEEKSTTPINTFIDMTKTTNVHNKLASGMGADADVVYTQDETGYRIWVSDGDITLNSASCIDGNGNLSGIVIAKGDVKFAPGVKSFTGLIVSGSKVICNNGNVTIRSSSAVTDALLTDVSGDTNAKIICDLFKNFSAEAGSNGSDDSKNFDAVDFHDVMEFNNWMKNVR